MSIPFNPVRRKSRAVHNEEWIETFLAHAPCGVVATAVNGQPYMNTLLFAYHAPTHAVYFHSSDQGRLADNVRLCSDVCFTASQMGRLLPASKACSFGVEYASVVIFGQAHILTEPAERAFGLQLLLDKYFPDRRSGEDYPALDLEQMRDTAVYRVDIQSWSAKREQAPEDFPGAFYFESQHEG